MSGFVMVREASMSQDDATGKRMMATWTQQADGVASDGAPLAWLNSLRASGRTAFERLGFPTTRDEAWRFTNIGLLTRNSFQPAPRVPHRLTPAIIERFCDGLPDSLRLVVVNGTVEANLSRCDGLPRDVVLSSLATDTHTIRARVENLLGKYAEYGQHAFAALNTACLKDVLVLLLPPGVTIEQPIHLLFVSVPCNQPTVSHPRILIHAEANSRATILESFVTYDAECVDAAPCFTNSVTEIALDEEAGIDYCRLQAESDRAFHIGTTQAQLAAGSRLDSHIVSFGGKLSRHELYAVLDGEAGECSLDGLTVARGRQLIDHQTRIDHVMPRCISRESYKSIIDDEAHGVFSGRIKVHPDAQYSDARQTNHTLLLSDNAVMDTQPQLEIYADDVKCTHGASVGSLDAHALFYMRSRGIGEDEARRLLTFAFINEILEGISADAVRCHLEGHLSGIMPFEDAESSRCGTG